MVDAVVTMVAAKLLYASKEWLGNEIALVRGVKKELENVSSKLVTIRNVLDDAEKRSINEKIVQEWLENLKDISYEMDDVLDEWSTSISTRKIEEPETPPVPKKQISCSFFTCFSFKEVGLRRDIALKVKEINTRLDSIIKEKDDFKLILKYPLPNRSVDSLEAARITTSIIRESEVYDRDSDRDTILRMLMSEGRLKEHRIPIISIIGVGGLGKTTLAKLIYNNDKVEKMFRKKIWVCVSDPFDAFKIASEIVEAINGIRPQVGSKNVLLQHLKESISNKKFLLILDDVWDENGEKWKEVRDCLEFGSVGSRILVTTRKEKVAKVMGTHTAHLHPLGKLSDTACWSLFSQIAFADRNEDECEILKAIGEKIVLKCKGLPLAVRVLANLLRFKNNAEEWQHVLDSEIWKLEEVKVELFPHLYLSYNELPSDIKRCFSHCSIFPKDSIIDVDELIRIWMAQGYITSSDDENYMELKGREIFNKLAMSSFFQDFTKSISGEIVTCKMHDIVHDFAQYLTRNECVTVTNGKSNSISKKVRHLTWLASKEVKDPILSGYDAGKLRSFLSEDGHSTQPGVVLSSLKCVRVLVLKKYDMRSGPPKELGKLIHLRYLHLSNLHQVPEAVCELYNLQTLNIEDCSQIGTLPENIGNLINLRHFFIPFKAFSYEFPESFEKLTRLQTLSLYRVGRLWAKLGYLKCLNHLGGSISIIVQTDMTVAEAVADAKKAELKNKKSIRELKLAFWNMDITLATMLEALQPPPNLQILEIYGFSGRQFPNWLTQSLNNLRVLKISKSINCSILPPFWKLPNLEELKICDISMIQVGREFFGIIDTGSTWSDGLRRARAFPKLTSLTFDDLTKLEKWEDLNEEDEDSSIEIMSKLQKLIIHKCKKLNELPCRLLHMVPSLKYMEIQKCGIFKNHEDDEDPRIERLLSCVPKVNIDGIIHYR